MRTSDVGRLISMFGLVGLTVITVISCGSSGNNSTTDVDASSDAFGGPGFSRDASGANTNNCVPKSCAQLGYNCGPNADGCGGTVDCGKCSGNEQCGIGGYSKCGDPTITPDGGHLCTPKTCADSGYECGVNADGCGGMVDCGSCPSGKQCGIGGFSKCGDPTVTPDGAPACNPQTCASLNYDCGLSGDGCGGQIGPCGTGTCTAPAFCGGGGPNKCGGNSNAPPDGGPIVACVPTTCANLAYTCGIAGDGCGGSTPSCGSCTSPQFCGGGGANKCGGNNGKGADGGPISGLQAGDLFEPWIHVWLRGRRVRRHRRPMRSDVYRADGLRRGREAQPVRLEHSVYGPLSEAGHLRRRGDDDDHGHRARRAARKPRQRAVGPVGDRPRPGAGRPRLHPDDAGSAVRRGPEQPQGPVQPVRRGRVRESAGHGHDDGRRQVHAIERPGQRERERPDPHRHSARSMATAVLVCHSEQVRGQRAAAGPQPAFDVGRGGHPADGDLDGLV